MLGLVLGGLAYLWAMQRDREIAAYAVIAAPPERVWQVLTDFPAYREWNPFILAIAGQPEVGRTLTVTIRPPGHDPVELRPVVLAADRPRELRWRGTLWLAFLFEGEHAVRLEPFGGGTRLVQSERFKGLLVGPATDRLIDDTGYGFTLMNQALKSRAELR